MAELNFTSLESIFQMITPSDLLAARKIALGKGPESEESIVRKLQRLLLENSGGMYSASQLLKELSEYRSKASGQGNDKKIFDRLINLYTTEESGKLGDVTYPYMALSPNGTKYEPCTVDQIIGAGASDRGKKPMSIILSKSAYISPAARDAQKVGVFLNFLPSIVISRCVPILELEFVFDRKYDGDERPLATASLMKFLLGGTNVPKSNEPDAAMYDSRSYKNKEKDEHRTTAGMELFTAPQTLINMDPVAAGGRYVPVIDPTRPLASLESATINVSPTVGVMSYKKANVVIKLHDRSRLNEFADIIQPTTYTRATVWLTYGWRHPLDATPDKTTQTYAEFINNNMLVKEAYGVMNSSYSFDASGQVTITLELFTKSISELKDAKVSANGDSFKKIAQDIENIALRVSELRRELKLDPAQGLNKEIRKYVILDAAERGSFQDMNPAKMKADIAALKKSLESDKKLPQGEVEALVKQLDELYHPDKANKNSNVFEFKARTKRLTTQIIKEKFDELKKGNDPFLIGGTKDNEKWKKMKEEGGFDSKVVHPLMAELDAFNSRSDVISDALKEEGLHKSVVSFGKLFMTFMAPALFQVQSDNEYQVLFYNFNDRCGPLSSCNVAEFPIDVLAFMRAYREDIESRADSTMTVEQFIKLAIDSQISDIRAIGYGFRSKGLFNPIDPKSKDKNTAKNTAKNTEKLDNVAMSINGRRGSFQLPQIEVYIEAGHEKTTQPIDLLTYYETGSSTGEKPADQGSICGRIVRIHIYDKTSNPYREAALLLASDSTSESAPRVEDDPWVTSFAASINGNLAELGKAAGAAPEVKSASTNSSIPAPRQTLGMPLNFDNKHMKDLAAQMVPTIVYGMNSSAVLDATLNTKHDANLTAAQLLGLNSGKKAAANPNGGGFGGLPLKIIPAELNARTIGCPLIQYCQLFFFDFNTGTTIDNIYGVTGITHTIMPGKFETSLNMAFHDAYGKYESEVDKVSRGKEMKEASS